jgi:NAD(P)-dependent dehydrogenase (short-subunit alcohol dehydrogenase family)
MATQAFSNNHPDRKAFIITGPTAGIGRATAFEVPKHGTVVLVGRDREKLSEVQKALQQEGGRAVSVVCDLSDMASVRHASAEIVALRLPIAGLLNNAGVRQQRPTKNAIGWDMNFATDHQPRPQFQRLRALAVEIGYSAARTAAELGRHGIEVPDAIIDHERCRARTEVGVPRGTQTKPPALQPRQT